MGPMAACMRSSPLRMRPGWNLSSEKVPSSRRMRLTFFFTAFFGEDFDLEIAACDVEAQGAVFQEEAGGTGKAGAVSCVGEFYVGFGQRNDDSFVMFIFSYEGMEFA